METLGLPRPSILLTGVTPGTVGSLVSSLRLPGDLRVCTSKGFEIVFPRVLPSFLYVYMRTRTASGFEGDGLYTQ